jgi:hypothetical protein
MHCIYMYIFCVMRSVMMEFVHGERSCAVSDASVLRMIVHLHMQALMHLPCTGYCMLSCSLHM